MRQVHRTLAAAGVVGILLAATACANAEQAPTGPGPSAPSSAAAAPGEGSGPVAVSAIFAKDDAALNYDKQLVPDNAKVFVAESVHDGQTTVTLNVRGLVPNRTYGAHAHAKPCGPKGDDAGPHFQHIPDPVKPSVDPAFANATNEIWLDFTTDAKGNATSANTVDWTFGDTPAGSVVIHAEPTKTAAGQAGVAGARAACVSVGF